MRRRSRNLKVNNSEDSIQEPLNYWTATKVYCFLTSGHDLAVFGVPILDENLTEERWQL